MYLGVCSCRRFERSWCLHLQGQAGSGSVIGLLDPDIFKALRYFEKFVITNLMVQHRVSSLVIAIGDKFKSKISGHETD
jgi:hypothetical protein